MNGGILIVDDEQAIRDALRGLFEDEGYLVTTAASGEEAVAKLRKHPFACVLLDIWMPGIDGLETLARIRRIDPALPVIMMSGHATIDTAVKATRQGAFDFVEKPLSSDRLLILVRNAIEKQKLQRQNRKLRDQEPERPSALIGSHPRIEEVRRRIAQIARSRRPVLLLGAHGSGKTLAARMLHRLSGRPRDAWCELGTASIPPGRFEAMLLGIDRDEEVQGRLATADGGSIYIDEVAELDGAAQALLLRLLDAQHYTPVGGVRRIRFDVRFVMGSVLSEEELATRLREDLFARIRETVIRLPELCQRREDIPMLIEELARGVARELGVRRPVSFDAEALERLSRYRWPGNLRELRNYIERCQLLHAEALPDGAPFGIANLPPVAVGGGASGAAAPPVEEGMSFAAARARFERDFLRRSLIAHDWNISRTAQAIGMERSQLHRKIRALGIEREESGS
ncbi:MAG: sigma-54-dependent Fis family transcriptional regulator [Zetaproteobacteria bacterium]|nr:MAG: sigma-54-dependent Fis family transcriptional regulator [Zetaproteobacteria bacterium]